MAALIKIHPDVLFELAHTIRVHEQEQKEVRRQQAKDAINIWLDKTIKYLPAEQEYGNIEYKWRLIGITENKQQKLATQMQFRLFEGNGSAVYVLGVKDCGQPCGASFEHLFETMGTIRRAAQIIKANVTRFHLYRGQVGLIATMRIAMHVVLPI
jgi:GTPase